MGRARQLRRLEGWDHDDDAVAGAGSGALEDPRQFDRARRDPHADQHRCVVHSAGLQRADDAGPLRPDRRTRGHRARRGMARLGRGRLCDGYDLVCRWRHDALPRVWKQRLTPQYTTTLRIDSPACIRSKPLLMSSSFKVCVIRSTRKGTRSPCNSFGLTKCVMPNCSARARRRGLISTPTIMSAPAIRQPCTTLSPMPPSPNTTTLAPGSTLAVLMTAPIPVVTPQPM